MSGNDVRSEARDDAEADAAPVAGTRPRSDWKIAAAVTLVFALGYTGLTQARFKGSDEVGVFQVTESLYERGTLVVPMHRHAHLGPDHQLYAAFAIGQSVLAVPLYATAKLARATLPRSWSTALSGPALNTKRSLRPERVKELRSALERGLPPLERASYGGSLETFFVGLYAPLVSAVLAGAIWWFLVGAGISRSTALTTTVLIGVCSYPAMMSIYFLRHTTEIVCIVFAFGWLRRYRDGGSLAALAVGSAWASAVFLVRFPGVLAGPAIGVYLVWCAADRWRVGDRVSLRHVLAVGGPLALALVTHMAINYAKWGSLIESPMVAGGLEASTSFVVALGAFLFSPGIGVFAYSPLLLLAPWTLRAAWRVWPAEVAAFGVLAATQLLFFSNYKYWTGLWSSPGPRYLLPGCVMLLLTLGPWLEGARSARARLWCWGLAAVGGVIQLGLLLGSWSSVIQRERYHDYEPQFSFLILPFESPIVASWEAIADGKIGALLWKFAIGWPKHEATPGIAVALLVVWLLALIAGSRWLRRVARDPA